MSAACHCLLCLFVALSACVRVVPCSKVVRKSIARVHTVYRANIRAALRSKISNDGANKKGRVSHATTGWGVMSAAVGECSWDAYCQCMVTPSSIRGAVVSVLARDYCCCPRPVMRGGRGLCARMRTAHGARVRHVVQLQLQQQL